MQLSETNARLRALQRVRRYKWFGVAVLAIAALGLTYICLIEDHLLAWLGLAFGPIGIAAGVQWWREVPMPYLDFAGSLAFGVVAAWGALRTGHPSSAWQLFLPAVASGGYVLYSARGQ